MDLNPFKSIQVHLRTILKSIPIHSNPFKSRNRLGNWTKEPSIENICIHMYTYVYVHISPSRPTDTATLPRQCGRWQCHCLPPKCTDSGHLSKPTFISGSFFSNRANSKNLFFNFRLANCMTNSKNCLNHLLRNAK